MILRSLFAAASALTLLAAAPALAQSKPLAQSTAFTLGTGAERTPEQVATVIDLADLSFKVLPATRTIEGDATLTLSFSQPVERIVLELDTVFAIAAVTVDGAALTPSQWSNPDGRLVLTPGRTLAAGEPVRVRIQYSGNPHQAVRAPWDGGFVWSTTPDGQPWIATAVQGEGCDLFWPCIDHPQGEPVRADLHITVPAGLSAPSNGRFLGKTVNADGTATWNWSAAHPDTYAIALNVGPYVELSADYRSRFGNTVPLHFWHLKTDKPERAAALFAEFPKMLDFYEATVGPFPFGDEKMGVVETPHLGMEHQTINAYGNAFELDGRGYDWLLQHELAHEWFGNQMTNATWDDMWLHEGLGTYMQPLYAR
ncbi:MAG: family peptidase, partial [Brevundimonas sp.]|nr:family peptidase [Brevundimonas sp.]